MMGPRLDRLLRAGVARWHAAPWQPLRTDLFDGPVPLRLIASPSSLTHFPDRLGLKRHGPHEPTSLVTSDLPRILAQALRQGETVVARLPRPLARRMSGIGLLVPEMVDAVIDMAEERWQRSRSATSNLRRIREHGLTWRWRTETDAFEQFYDQCYAPYMRLRHGPDALVRGRFVLRRWFRQGGIQEVRQGERVLAAQLVAIHERSLECIAVGVTGDAELARQTGAVAATTAFAIEFAREQGLATVNLGGSLPFRRDPVLLSKSYWGARVVERQRADHDLLLAWPTWSDPVADLLGRLAPIIRGPAGLIGIEVSGLRMLHGLASLPIGAGGLPEDSSHRMAQALDGAAQLSS